MVQNEVSYKAYSGDLLHFLLDDLWVVPTIQLHFLINDLSTNRFITSETWAEMKPHLDLLSK